jgi:hypothetical protein
MDIHAQIASKIIQAQESIVGPVAFEQAKKVAGLKIGKTDTDIKLEGDKKAVLEQLIKQYEGMFGRASIEVCKNAVRGIINNVPKDQVPQLLLT